MKEKLKTIDNSLKAWVGGLPKELTWKKLKEHFTDLGCEPDIVDITKPGKGVVTFKTEDEATTAISIAMVRKSKVQLLKSMYGLCLRRE